MLICVFDICGFYVSAPSQPPSNVNGVPISADSILVQWQVYFDSSH